MMNIIARDAATQRITRGVCRLLMDMGYCVLREFKLTSGRRVDVAGLDNKGHFVVVEVKSSLADFRSDEKWPEYLPYCDAFYFAVGPEFPADILPEDQGVLVADGFGGVIRRPSEVYKMNGQRRKSQTIRFARASAQRLESNLEKSQARTH